MVAFFSTRPHFGADIAGALTNVEDIGRIVQRFIMGRGDSGDLLAVNRTIQVWSTVIKRFQEEKMMEAVERTRTHDADWTSLDALMSRIVDLQDLSTRITMALDDEYRSSPCDLSISEDLQVNDDKLEDAPALSADNTLWRYGSGKWVIKPGYSYSLLPAHKLERSNRFSSRFSSTLATLHRTLRELFQKRERLEKDLQLRYGRYSS